MRSSLAALVVIILVAPATGHATDLIWTNAAGGSWTTPNHWSPNQVPQAADRVFLTNAGAYVVSLTNATAVHSLFLGTPGGAQVLNLGSNSILTVTTSVQLNGGSVQGAGRLTVGGQMDWTAGRMFGPGMTRIDPGATLNVNPGPSDSPRLAGRRMDNAGTVHWFGRGFAADSGAQVNNLASGVFDVHTNGSLSGSWSFANAGVLRKSAGAGVLTLSGAFTNSNRVDVQAGSLTLSGGGVHSGLFTVASAASLAFVSVSPATHTFAGGGVVGGNVSFSGVTGANPTNLPIRIDGGYDVGGITTVGRGVTVNFSPASTVTNLGTNVFVTGGTLNLDSASSLSVTNLNLVGGRLSGSNTLTVVGDVVWTNSSVEGTGTLNVHRRVTIDGNNSLLGWTLNSLGASFWNSGSIATGNGSVINCASNSTFSIIADGNMTGTANTLINSGTLVRSNGTGTAFIAGSFTNFGMVELLSGTLSFGQTYHQAAGSTRLLGGNLAAPNVDIAAGLIEGSGFITGSVSNNATILLGQDRPPLFISGDYLQSTNGIISINLPLLVLKTNSLVVGGAASLSGLLTNCLDCPLPLFPIPARTNFAFLTASNPPAPTVEAGFTISFPTNQIGLGVEVRNDSRLVPGGRAAVIAVVNTLPYFSYTDLGHISEEAGYTTNLVASDDDDPAQVMTYVLLSPPPAGLSLALNGQLTWTPDECQGPTNITLTVMVTDNGTPPLSATTNLTITVDEVNRAPVFPPPPTFTISEGVLFTTNLLAIDYDCPTNTIRYALSNAVAGMTIDPNSAAFSWTPTLQQGGSNFTITVIATDTNLATIPPSSATVTTDVTFQVIEVNLAPFTLPVPALATNFETVEFRLTLTGIDTNDPPNQLAFEIVQGPAGMTNILISTNVVFSAPGTNAALTNIVQLIWTPGEVDGPSTNVISVRFTDNGVPPLSATQSFTLFVLETNSAPVWTDLFTTNLGEGVTFTLNLGDYVFDSDVPTNSAFTFSLVSPVTGAGVTNGVLSFTPTELQGGSTVIIPLSVTDSNAAALPGNRQLTVTTNLSITVIEVNTAPVITLVGSTNFVEGITNTLTFRVFDSDLPANSFTYILTPAVGSLSPTLTTSVTNGTNIVLRWVPDESEGPQAYGMTLSVTDNNPQALVNSNLTTSLDFAIQVAESNRPPVPILSGTNLVATNSFTVIEGSNLTIIVTASDLDLPANTLTFSLTNHPAGMTITNTGATNAVITWVPTEFQGGPSNYLFQVLVNDGIASVSTNLHVRVLETNNFAPVFTWPVPGQTNYVTAVQKNKTGTSISVRATDGDWPTQSVTFRLTNAPAPPGFSVTAGGVLNWKNNLTINDTNHLTVIATDNGTPPLSTTNRFTLTYIGANANTAPFFVFPPTNKSFSIRTNEALSTNFLALDLDLPSQALVFTNVGVWPTGAVVQSNGAFFWRPDGSQAGTNTLFVKVSDNQTPSLSATQSFIIKVRTEANLPPFFTLATNVLTFLEHSNNVSVLSASDPDLATGDSISWSLLPPIPDGLGIDPVSGSLSWTPGSDAGPSTNQVSVRITDESGESATTDIFIRVRESNTAPVFSPPVAGVSYSVLTNAPFNASFTSVDLDIPTNNAVNIALVSSPPGAVLVSTPGTNVATATLSWINSGAVSTNTFTIITWDTNTLDAVHPRLTNTATFFVIVREANTFAPVLTVSNLTVTIDELVTNVVVNVSATDADVPANVLKFAVTVTNLADGLPVNGISINPDSGVLTWAPTEEQGPTTNLVTVDVYDDGFPALTNRGTFTIRVREDNQPPDIDPISSPQFSPEGMTTTLSVTAVDFDSPVQTLSYAVRATNVLTSLAVTNMTINGSGILSWTPTEEQGPSTNLVVVIVWDDDLLNPLTNSVVFTNIATELNAAPVFLSPASGTVFCVTTGAVFTVTNVVFDPDLPANALTFATNFPVGAVMMTSSVTGATHVVITWTNSLALGSTQHFVIVARDTNMFDAINPTFSATNDLVVVGLPGNPTAPALTVLSSQLSIDANITSTISNVFVTDPDANSIFHFGLASVVETNTMAGTLNPSINLTNGVITWHPTSGEAPGTYRVNLLVTNLGCPTHLVGTNFLVTVLATNHAPSLTFPTNSQVFSNIVGQPFILTAVASDDTTPATNLLFTLFNPPTNAFTFTNGVFSWTPVLDQIGTNNFSISASDTNSPSRSVTNAFSVIVHPVIAPFSPGGAFVPAGGFLFEVNLKPGLTYNIQASLDCPPGPNWVNVRTVTPTNSPIVFPVDADRLATNGAIFYRALIRP